MSEEKKANELLEAMEKLSRQDEEKTARAAEESSEILAEKNSEFLDEKKPPVFPNEEKGPEFLNEKGTWEDSAGKGTPGAPAAKEEAAASDVKDAAGESAVTDFSDLPDAPDFAGEKASDAADGSAAVKDAGLKPEPPQPAEPAPASGPAVDLASAAAAPASGSAVDPASAAAPLSAAAASAATTGRSRRKAAKKAAKEDLQEMARQTRADKKQWKMQRRRQKSEDRQKYPTGRLRRKARRLRWKQMKLDRRQALKERYQDAPWILRVCRLYLVKPLVALLILALIAGGIYLNLETIVGSAFMAYFDGNKNREVSQETIHALSPIDKDGAKRIDAVPPAGKDDTWTIGVYLVGSNLEDMDENDLSALVQVQAAQIREETEAESRAGYRADLNNFTAEMEGNDLEPPAYLYYPKKPVEGEDHQSEDSGNTVAELPGCASTDIGEMTSDTWSDKIRIVIQTGGATRWSNSMVNPNRTQRFLYYKGEFREVDDQPLQIASRPETLTSFLNFCRKEYPADHNMLVLWNHGGGAFGYGHDSIGGGMMSLKDIREGLEGAYKPSDKEPAFDIIGFDACLMSSLEVAHALDGFASYYAVSEEVEPGDGWDYGPWLKAMTKDPTMSPARVCREIADTYTDHYMTQNANIGWLLSSDVTFSVLDAAKASQLYDAWCDMNQTLLLDAIKDNSVLSEMGRCSDKTTHYAAAMYNVYNTIDLGGYIDLMADSYPKECNRIKRLLGETVMYHRENGSLSDSQGISVYLPGAVNDINGLLYCMDYVYNICEDPATAALYYYKISGCLNEEMQEYLATLTDRKPKTLNLKPFRQFARQAPVTSDSGFSIPVNRNLQSMLQAYNLEVGIYDEEEEKVINYGQDELVRLDGEGGMNCEFDGTWICYDGVPLATEVVASTDSSVEYRSRVLYNNMDAWLSFTYDRDTEEFTINGVRSNQLGQGGLLDDDPFNYLVNSRTNQEVKRGDVIVPVYEVQNTDAKASDAENDKGKEIRVGRRSQIKVEKLPSGYYLTAAVISDHRGDVYYSQVVGSDVSGGKVKKRTVDSRFVGRDY